MASPELPPLALIAGPTASGKSALALALAEQTGGVIVNADASQVYRDLAILSARPDAADEARADHRLYGHVDGAVACSAADWAAAAKAEIATIHADGRLPILVGGTGLYIRTLLDGIAPIPPVPDAVRAEVRALSTAEARAALEREDAAAAARLAPADTTRNIRALEVVRATGRSILDWRAASVGGIGDRVTLDATVIDPPVDLLHARCDARVAAMLASGAIDEVARLRARRLNPALPVMRAIGVAAIGEHLDGRLSLAEAGARIAHDTRRYVKRQKTWGRNQFPAAWRRVPIPDTEKIEG